MTSKTTLTNDKLAGLDADKIAKRRPHDHLTAEDYAAIGERFDAIRQRILDDRGEVDATYIRKVVKVQRAIELGGRGSLMLSFLPPFWVAGVALLGTSKILDNMEIGHNIIHGQYDWMNDPVLHSSQFDWDHCSPAENWKHGHNNMHHTWTNVVGKDRDIGYGFLRLNEGQKWRPDDIFNPVKAFWLAVLFEYGIALHDLEVDNLMTGKIEWEEVSDYARLVRKKVKKQALKDFVLFPALAGPMFPLVLAGNFSANIVRNLWTFGIIFCGHFPDGTELFTEEDIENETRGHWYVRQLLGSANIDGGPLFHVMSGNLSHQIEHHVFPDLPARRYQEIASEVQAICEEYNLPYNTGKFRTQFGSVVKRICKLALPWTNDDAR